MGDTIIWRIAYVHLSSAERLAFLNPRVSLQGWGVDTVCLARFSCGYKELKTINKWKTWSRGTICRKRFDNFSIIIHLHPLWEVNIHFLLIYSLSGPRNLPEYFQNVAAFILKFGSSQSQTGSSSTLIFQMHFVTVHRNLSLSNILRPMKLASTLVTRCSESDSFLEHDQQHFSCWWKLEALNFFLCKSY